METDNKNLLKETETTIGLKALAYKKIFFDNKSYQFKLQSYNEVKSEKTVIDKNKCKGNF
jgi:hypothetical protein